MKFFKMSAFEETDGYVGRIDKIFVNKRHYFIAPVYIAVDNTLHLVLMWVLLSFLGECHG